MMNLTTFSMIKLKLELMKMESVIGFAFFAIILKDLRKTLLNT